jgi:hypothetical protein
MKIFGALKRWQSNWGIIYSSDGITTTKYFLQETNIVSGRENVAFGAGVHFDVEPARRPQELDRAINAEVGEIISLYQPKATPYASTAASPGKEDDGKGGAA